MRSPFSYPGITNDPYIHNQSSSTKHISPPANTTCEHKNQNMTTYKYNFAKHTQHAHKSTHARTEGWVTYNITRTYRPLPQPTRVNSAIKTPPTSPWPLLHSASARESYHREQQRLKATFSKHTSKSRRYPFSLHFPSHFDNMVHRTRYKIITPCLSRLYTRIYPRSSPISRSKIPPTNNNTHSQNEGLGLRWTVISMGYTSRN